MVAHEPLELGVQVRILASQPAIRERYGKKY